MDIIIKEKYLPKLEADGILKKADVENIINKTNVEGTAVVDVLVNENYISEKDIEIYLHETFGIGVIDPLADTIPDEIVRLVSSDTARKYLVMPVCFEHNALIIAAVNPLDVLQMDNLRVILGLDIKPRFAFPAKLNEALKKYYTEDVQQEEVNIDTIIAEATADDLEVIAEDKSADINSLLQAVDETPVIKITNLILMEGIKRRASDIFIEPWEKHMSVRCRVDGLLELMKSPPKSMAQSIVSRIKVMSNLDIAERRMPQDGRFKIKYQNRFVEFRVSVLPSSFGEKVCLRILDKSSQSQDLESLGFTDTELERIKSAAAHPHGMILVTGPTGSGKTTTLYSILGHIDAPEKNITTVEDPVEYQIYGINQVNIREQVGLTFPASLRSILRQDPDIIMVGEIRDYITMDIAIKAALTGHLVLSTLHTNDACGSIIRITNMGIEPFLIASSVLMVSAQRLIRKLCPHCKEPFDVPDEVLKGLDKKIDKDVTLYRAVGCDACRDSGYLGRTVITEVLPITPSIRHLVMKKETAEVIKKVARKEGMTTLRESGINKALNGESTLDEVYRITAADQPLEQKQK